MREGQLRLVSRQGGGHHDQVAGHALGVLLGEGSQLVVHGAIEFLTRHVVR